MRAGKPVGDFQVNGVARFWNEGVEILPTVLAPELEDSGLLFLDNPEPVMTLRCLAGVHRNRLKEPGPTEANVAEVGLSLDSHHKYHVGPRPDSCPALTNPRLTGHDLKSDGLQDVEKQRVLLKTVSASPTSNHFVLQTFKIEPDGQAHLDVEVLEWDGRGMSQVKGPKRWQLR